MQPIQSFQCDSLAVRIYEEPNALSEAVADEVHAHLADTLARNGRVAAIMATGNSQIRFLELLAARGGIDWSRVTLFHMDEYLGVGADHPAGFQSYMRERVESRVRPGAFHYLRGDALLPLDECDRYGGLLRAQPIDLCCLGVGENGHLAFNDPPVADFEDPRPVKLVKLDDPCKQQQVDEGHFPNLEAVPPYAYTLTIPTLMSATKVICLAPETRKAKPVRDLLEGPVSTACPASILRRQSHATLFLDRDSASLLAKSK